MKYLLCLLALMVGGRAGAQAPAPVAAKPAAYEFLTFIESESRNGSEAKLLFAPDFHGQAELKLEELEGPVPMKNSAVYRRNVQLVNQQLAVASAEGWELVGFSASNGITLGGETRYLLRRVKR